MASPRTKRVLRELKFQEGNNSCFECNQHNPQWVSVPYSIWICLECSVKHRSLGGNLSFVRSATMDKWKDVELEKMKTGGNLKAGVFFTSQSDYREGMSIQEKYNTKAAALYRDKIATEAAGETWSEATSAAKDYKPTTIPGEDDGGGGSSDGSTSSPPDVSSMDNLERYLGKSRSSISFKKDDDIQRQMAENQAKSEDLSPSQGGKYVGFGSSSPPPSTPTTSSGGWSSPLSTLQDGWNLFSLGAQQLADVTVDLGSKVNENVIKPTSEFTHAASEKAMDLSSKVNESVFKATATKASELAHAASEKAVNLGSKVNESMIKPTANWGSEFACVASEITVDLGSKVNENVIKPTAHKASEFASVASEKAVDLGSKVNEKVILPTANKATELGTSVGQSATEGTLARDMQGSLKGAAEKMTNVSMKGWYSLQSYLGYGASTLEEDQACGQETATS